MTQIQKLTDSQLIKYVERVGEKIRETGIVPDKWVYYRRELERRGYIFWFYTGKVIRNASAARGCWHREFANIKIR